MAKIKNVSDTQYFNSFIDRKVAVDAIIDVNKFLIPIFNSHIGNRISTKTKSELISSSLEYSFTEHLSFKINTPVSSAGSDNDPDIIIGNREAGAEIKVASCKLSKKLMGDVSWRGGSFSKRGGDYLMVSWAFIKEIPSFFIAYAKIEEDDWIGSGSGNYYATTVSINHLFSNLNPTIIVGDIEKNRNGNSRIILETL